MGDIWSDDSVDSLTLPAGATTGARVELDGLTQEIRIYNSSNNLIGTLGPNGLIVSDPDGSQIRVYDQNPGSGAIIEVRPANVPGHVVTAAQIYADADPGSGYPRLILYSPILDASDQSYIMIQGGDASGPPPNEGLIWIHGEQKIITETAVVDFRNAAGTDLLARLTSSGLYAGDPVNVGSNDVEVWNAFPFNGALGVPWSNVAGGMPFQFMRVASPANHIVLTGEINAGTKADGTLIGTLPVGYRPAHRVTIPVGMNPVTAGSTTPILQVSTSGAVTCFGMTSATIIYLNSQLISLDA